MRVLLLDVARIRGNQISVHKGLLGRKFVALNDQRLSAAEAQLLGSALIEAGKEAEKGEKP